ncbi:MAG: DUF2007 domain-containing protein [Bacteroidetes bacterium]|nr:DUF2007 domain-containing protein [Bacteroidota bacterium]
MQKGWQPVYYSDKMHLVQIAKALLADHNIESFEMNRKDSTYITIGDIELYVKDTDVMRAKYILEQNNL